MKRDKRTGEPRASSKIVAGVHALLTREETRATAFEIAAEVAGRPGHFHWTELLASRCAPNGMATTEDVANALHALDFAREWEAWNESETRRKIKAHRKAIRSLARGEK